MLNYPGAAGGAKAKAWMLPRRRRRRKDQFGLPESGFLRRIGLSRGFEHTSSMRAGASELFVDERFVSLASLVALYLRRNLRPCTCASRRADSRGYAAGLTLHGGVDGRARHAGEGGRAISAAININARTLSGVTRSMGAGGRRRSRTAGSLRIETFVG